MRVVVTGAAGFIGSHVSDRLIADGHEVVGVDCFTDYYARSDKDANVRALRDEPRFSLVEADLRVDDLAPILDGADAVINEAATPGLVLSWEDFERYESCNVYAVHRLIKACKEAHVPRVVHASTSSVYGPVATGTEGRETRPISPYGVTKLAAEHLLLAHHDMFGLPVIVLRYFSIYGPRQRPDMAYRIFCERLLRGEPLTVYGDGRQTRGNTYVADCVDATVRALDRGASGAVLNVGGGTELALLDAIELIGDALGVVPTIHFEAPRAGDQQRTIADTALAREVLGWEPTVTPDVGLRREAEWVRERHRSDVDAVHPPA